jgi:hypothetical protein
MRERTLQDVKVTEEEVRAQWAAVQTERRAIVARFCEACRAADVEAIRSALSEIGDALLWPAAAQKVARLGALPLEAQTYMLEYWISSGDTIRDGVNNDLILMKALRVLLPPYRGPDLTLWRGDSFFNRRCRTYGLSWTASKDIAVGFARAQWRTFEGGSVVLETVAPASAIICAPHLLNNDYEEDEYLVDRRLLNQVTVVERLGQMSPDEIGEEFSSEDEQALERLIRGWSNFCS